LQSTCTGCFTVSGALSAERKPALMRRWMKRGFAAQHSAGDVASAACSVSTARSLRECSFVATRYVLFADLTPPGLIERESASSRSCDITLASLRLRYRDCR
jgi:hypothetical protein